MYHTTGFSSDEITTLCALVAEIIPAPSARGRKQKLRLFKSVVVTLCYLRRNHVQQELGELFGASKSTISRTISRFIPILGELLRDWVPTVEDLDPTVQFIIDGTLLPCWSRSDHPENFSGKHHTTAPQRPGRLHAQRTARLGLPTPCPEERTTQKPSASLASSTSPTSPPTSATKATSGSP